MFLIALLCLSILFVVACSGDDAVNSGAQDSDDAESEAIGIDDKTNNDDEVSERSG